VDYEKRIAELEAEVSRLQKRLDQAMVIFDGSPVGIELFDTEGKLTACNQAARLMLGYSPDREDFDVNLFEDMPFPDEEKAKLEKQQPVTCEIVYDFGVIRQVDLTRTTFFGKKVLDIIMTPLRNNWEFSGYLALIQDITEERKSARELVEAKDKAEHSNKMKSSFLASMSHEIRTPLNAIIGFSNLLGEQDLGPEKRNEYIGIINKSSQHLLELISDIIDISKIESEKIELDPQAYEAREVLNSIFNTFVIQYAESSVGFRMKLPDNNVKLTFQADITRFNQVFNNLISNAFKFTSKGFVEIGCENPGPADSSLTFYVKDSGIGIPEEKQEVIFEQFRQADKTTTRNFGGTGLGLSICRKLLDLMDGEIHCKSEPGQGSYFYFSLPRV